MNEMISNQFKYGNDNLWKKLENLDLLRTLKKLIRTLFSLKNPYSIQNNNKINNDDYGWKIILKGKYNHAIYKWLVTL